MITWLNHFGALWELDATSDIGGAEVELWTIVVEEWSVAATLVLGKDVNLSLELGVRSDGTWSSQHLTTLDLVTVDTAEEQTDVVASLSGIHDLVEGLDGGNGGGLGILQTNNLNWGVGEDLTTGDTTGDHGTTTGDGEDILDWHEEWLVEVVNWGWDVLIDCVHELLDLLNPVLVVWLIVVQCAVSGDAHDWAVAVEAVLFEQVASFLFDEIDELLVLNHIALVQSDEDLRDADLLCEQDVLTGLSHRTIVCSHNEDCAIHLIMFLT